MNPVANIKIVAATVVCLGCGAIRIATKRRTSITPGNCVACGYVGWRVAQLDERPPRTAHPLTSILHLRAAHSSA
jgi:hypothetical protein